MHQGGRAASRCIHVSAEVVARWSAVALVPVGRREGAARLGDRLREVQPPEAIGADRKGVVRLLYAPLDDEEAGEPTTRARFSVKRSGRRIAWHISISSSCERKTKPFADPSPGHGPSR